MNGWLLAAIALLLTLVPCGVVIVRGRPADQLVAFEAAGGIETLLLLLLAEALHRPAFFDLALTLALLSFAGSLVFARLFERWL